MARLGFGPRRGRGGTGEWAGSACPLADGQRGGGGKVSTVHSESKMLLNKGRWAGGHRSLQVKGTLRADDTEVEALRTEMMGRDGVTQEERRGRRGAGTVSWGT